MMHFVTTEDEFGQKRETWHFMHFKKDFIRVLKKHGKLPEATLEDYISVDAKLERLEKLEK